MPLYEYKCMACDTVEAKLTTREERDGKFTCDDCGAKRIRLFSTPGHVWSPTRN